MKKAALIVLVLLLAATLAQWGLDTTPAGTETSGAGYFPSMSSLMNLFGGVRQYIAYTLYIKSDMIHHAYYGALGKEAELVPYYILIALLDPNYESTYYVGAEEMYRQGSKEEAIDFNLRGIEANPDSADLYFGLAGIYLEEKRYEDAKQAFMEALERTPEIATINDLLTGLSATCKALGEPDEQRKVLMTQAIYNEIRLYREDLTDAQRIYTVQLVNNCINAAVAESGVGP